MTAPNPPLAAYVLNRNAYDLIYGPAEREDIEDLVRVQGYYEPKQIVEEPGLLRDVEIVMGGWGTPRFDAAVLAAAPKLRAILYGAGSVRGVTSDELWKRGIVVCSSWGANAEPVAEYTLAQIFMGLKKCWYYAIETKRLGRRAPWVRAPGAYGATVGLISLGMIGRRVCTLLKNFEVSVVAYDPFVTPAEAEKLGVKLVDLEDVFRIADVVSLHTPWLKETEGMIRGKHFEMMKHGATFVNTARGALVREAEMIQALKRRPDVYAVLDVTYPEPPVEGSELYTLPNAILTPHIAGSQDAECQRMGRFMVDELSRLLSGQTLKWALTKERAEKLA